MNFDEAMDRRDFLRAGGAGAVLGAAGLALGATLPASAPSNPAVHGSMLDVKMFGAVGDGKTDDTRAIQKALDAAAGSSATVYVPAGVYLCSTIKMPPHVGLLGSPTWSYKEPGGSILRLADEKAPCLIDITGATGVMLNGLCLDGATKGQGVHGVWLNNTTGYSKVEDMLFIERCQIKYFTGDGIRLDRAWCYNVRHNMIGYNTGNGLRVRGWDGYVLDNWLSNNGEAGFGAYEENTSVNITANRIEWNRGGNIFIKHGSTYSITGNYLDAAGRAGLSLLGDSHHFTVTGNVFFRNARPVGSFGAATRPLEENDDCHIRLETVDGVVVSGNIMFVGRDDHSKGPWSPGAGIILRSLANCIIKDNAMHWGAMKKLVLDLGGHRGEIAVKDNIGILAQIRPQSTTQTKPAS